MDSGYNTEEEWLPNPYQAEADAYLQRMFPHLSNDGHCEEHDGLLCAQSPGDDSSQSKKKQKLPRRFRGPCTRNLKEAPATNLDMGGPCSAHTTFACSFGRSSFDSVHERCGSTYSGCRNDEGLPSNSYHGKSGTQDDNSLSFSFDRSTAVSGVQSSFEAWVPEHQLMRSRKVDCDYYLAAVSSNRYDANTGGTSHGWSSERPTLEIGAQIHGETEFHRNDSTLIRHDELTTCSFPRVHQEQDPMSAFGSTAGYPSHREVSAVPEHPRPIQPYEHNVYSRSCTGICTRNETAAHESHRHVDRSRSAQSQQQRAVSSSGGGEASVDASNGSDFSKDRLRKVLLHDLMQDSECIKDRIKGWNNETKCIVTFGVMEQFARQGNIYHTEKCAELMLHFGSSSLVARTFNVMIAACMKDGHVNAALRWWSHFTSLGVEPTIVTYNSMINVCARGRDLGHAEWWMERMLQDGIKPCLKSFTALVVACGQSGSERKAEYWFGRMHAYGLCADAILYNAMIDACAKVGNAAKAEMWFDKMQAEGVTPDQRTFNTLLYACAKSGNTHGAEQWHIMMLEAGLRCDEYTYGSLIEGCVKHHDMSRAEHLLRRMFSEKIKPNLVILRSLSKVYGLTDSDRLAKVLELCVRDGGVSPDDVRKSLKARLAHVRSQALEEFLADISMTIASAETGRHGQGK